MILRHHIPSVSALLKTTAERAGTASFRTLHALFDKDELTLNVYDTLDQAALELADFRTAIYSVVLAKQNNRLPGSAFFSLYRTHRYDEFRRIAGDVIEQELNLKQMTEMMTLERNLVYAHAAR